MSHRSRVSTLLGALLMFAVSATATIYTVDVTYDGIGIVGSGCQDLLDNCTLRLAILEANQDSTTDTIILPEGRFKLTRQGIDDIGSKGDLDIIHDLSIIGAGADKTIIDADGIDRVFDLHPGAAVAIYAVTIQGGAPADDDYGGGVRGNYAALRLQQCRIVGNLEGAVWLNYASWVEITRSSIEDNINHSNGIAAGFFFPVGTVSIDRTSIVKNRCLAEPSSCGNGALNLQSCQTVSALTLENSTVADNEGSGAWVLACEGSIRNSTIVSNELDGVSYTARSSQIDGLDIRHSILSNNGRVDCDLPVSSDIAGENNLDSDGTCGLDAVRGDLPSTDPELYPLGYYPAETPSHHPRRGSPVVDGGLLPLLVGSTCATDVDQDGFSRAQDGDNDSFARCDIGSIEVLPCVLPFENRYINDAIPIGAGVHASCNLLYSQNSQVEAATEVTFSARHAIILDNDFRVETGGTFTAEIVRTAGSGM